MCRWAPRVESSLNACQAGQPPSGFSPLAAGPCGRLQPEQDFQSVTLSHRLQAVVVDFVNAPNLCGCLGPLLIAVVDN